MDVYFVPVLLLFCCSNYSTFGYWEPFQGSSCSLMICPSFFENFLFFFFLVLWEALGLFHIFLATPQESTTFPWRPDSFYYRILFRNQDLGSRNAPCWRITASRPSQQTELGNQSINQSIYIHTRFHTHLYLLSSLCIH